MKNIFKSFVIMLITAFVLTACGGSSSDSGPGVIPAGTFTKTVALSNVTNLWSSIIFTDSFRHYQMLYKPADIAGSGSIKSLYLRYNADMTTSTTCPHITIKLAHSSVTDVTTNMATNINQGKGSAITVVNDSTITIPAGAAGDYFEIPLSTEFNYNGVDNLVLDITRTAASSQGVGLRAGSGLTTYQAGVYSNDIANPDTGGSTSSTPLHVKFVFEGGDNIAVSSSGSGNSYPFTTSLGGQKMQQLYLASEINGSGPITGIAFSVSAVSEELTYTYNVTMGHTNLTSLGTSFSGNFNAGAPTTVASSVNLVVPNGTPTGSYVWIPIPNGTFAYNGTDNLVIQIEVTSASNTLFRQYNSVAGRRLYAASGSDTGNVDNVLCALKLRFYGGTMDVITAGNLGDFYPFSDSTNNKRQYLYLASELGTKGTITKVAFRLDADSVLSAYNSFKVVLGHTTNTTLGTTFSTNMTGAQTVYAGTFSIPAGLKAGDWLEIPLSSPFVYDSSKNLVVETSSLFGTAANDLKCAAVSTNRHGYASSNTTDTATVNNYLSDLQLKMQ